MKLNYYQSTITLNFKITQGFWIDFAIYKVSFNTGESISGMVHRDKYVKEHIYDFILFLPWSNLSRLQPSFRLMLNHWCNEWFSILLPDICFNSGLTVLTETDLFCTPTDCNQFLHFNSVHPFDNKKPIVYSQVLRIKRLCSSPLTFQKHLENLKTW